MLCPRSFLSLLSSPECQLQVTYQTKWLMYVCSPLGVVALLALIYYVGDKTGWLTNSRRFLYRDVVLILCVLLPLSKWPRCPETGS